MNRRQKKAVDDLAWELIRSEKLRQDVLAWSQKKKRGGWSRKLRSFIYNLRILEAGTGLSEEEVLRVVLERALINAQEIRLRTLTDEGRE